jgi:hypothetical protein
MQTWSGPEVAGTHSPTRRFATTVLLIFALAGLIAGFAFGGLTSSRSRTTTITPPPIKKTAPVVQSTNAVTPTATPENVLLGFPQWSPAPPPSESAANSTGYTIGMQAVDKQKKPVHSADLTCKAWLVPQIPAGQILNIDSKVLKDVNNLSNPIQGTVNGQPVQEVLPGTGLTFDPSTPQTARCSSNGQITWKYTISSTVPPGNYSIVILVDWKGIHFNWAWDNIAIK